MSAVRLPDYGEKSDRLYDEARQSLADARAEGYRAGRQSLSVEMNSYCIGTAEHAEWNLGRLEGLAAQTTRRTR